MKLDLLRIQNFQSFGSEPTEIKFSDLTFLIGPNGAGKTAALQALSRLFDFFPGARRVQRSDFHVPFDEDPENRPTERDLFIEAEFTFEELEDESGEHPTVPPRAIASRAYSEL